jgi:hypothetical protein
MAKGKPKRVGPLIADLKKATKEARASNLPPEMEHLDPVKKTEELTIQELTAKIDQFKGQLAIIEDTKTILSFKGKINYIKLLVKKRKQELTERVISLMKIVSERIYKENNLYSRRKDYLKTFIDRAMEGKIPQFYLNERGNMILEFTIEKGLYLKTLKTISSSPEVLTMLKALKLIKPRLDPMLKLIFEELNHEQSRQTLN